MILVDTTVWVEHLRHGLPRLATLLQEGEVLIPEALTFNNVYESCANALLKNRPGTADASTG